MTPVKPWKKRLAVDTEARLRELFALERIDAEEFESRYYRLLLGTPCLSPLLDGESTEGLVIVRK